MRARSQDPADAVEHTTIIHPRHTARFVRQHRPDGSPLIVGEFVAHDSSPSLIRMDYRWAIPSDTASIQRFAKELVALRPDLILTQNTPNTVALF